MFQDIASPCTWSAVTQLESFVNWSLISGFLSQLLENLFFVFVLHPWSAMTVLVCPVVFFMSEPTLICSIGFVFFFHSYCNHDRPMTIFTIFSVFTSMPGLYSVGLPLFWILTYTPLSSILWWLVCSIVLF